jgi:hypothetical protein
VLEEAKDSHGHERVPMRARPRRLAGPPIPPHDGDGNEAIMRSILEVVGAELLLLL